MHLVVDVEMPIDASIRVDNPEYGPGLPVRLHT